MGSPRKTDTAHRVTQTEVRRYIMAHFMPLCTSEPMPFRERELARTLKVNRLTVRRAAAELARQGILIPLPGRRGLFLNPDCRITRRSEKYYGILVRSGEVPVLSLSRNRILNGFLQHTEGEEGYVDCQFLTLTGRTPERMADEIMTWPLHALIWFAPPPDMYPVLDLLLERSFPLAVVRSIFDPRIPPFHTNSISLDYYVIGRLLAEKVLSSGARKILFAGLRSETFESFRRALAEHHFSYTSRNFLDYSFECHDPEKLADRIRRGGIDLVVSDGVVLNDLQKLSGLIDFASLRFLLLPFQWVKSVAAAHPKYPLIFPDYDMDDNLERLGRTLAEKIAGPAPVLRFPNIVLPIKAGRRQEK